MVAIAQSFIPNQDFSQKGGYKIPLCIVVYSNSRSQDDIAAITLVVVDIICLCFIESIQCPFLSSYIDISG